MWTLIVAIVVGFIAGLIARAIYPGNNNAGFIVTTYQGLQAQSLRPMVDAFQGSMQKIHLLALLLLSLALL